MKSEQPIKQVLLLFSLFIMALAIDITDGRGFSNEARHELLLKKSKVMLY